MECLTSSQANLQIPVTVLSSVQKSLLPHLNALNGVNARSVVVLDNASIHHTSSVVCIMQRYSFYLRIVQILTL